MDCYNNLIKYIAIQLNEIHKKRIILVLHTCENNGAALFVQKLNNVANWKHSCLILNA